MFGHRYSPSSLKNKLLLSAGFLLAASNHLLAASAQGSSTDDTQDTNISGISKSTGYIIIGATFGLGVICCLTICIINICQSHERENRMSVLPQRDRSDDNSLKVGVGTGAALGAAGGVLAEMIHPSGQNLPTAAATGAVMGAVSVAVMDAVSSRPSP